MTARARKDGELRTPKVAHRYTLLMDGAGTKWNGSVSCGSRRDRKVNDRSKTGTWRAVDTALAVRDLSWPEASFVGPRPC